MPGRYKYRRYDNRGDRGATETLEAAVDFPVGFVLKSVIEESRGKRDENLGKSALREVVVLHA
jgi:hypothetical protein